MCVHVCVRALQQQMSHAISPFKIAAPSSQTFRWPKASSTAPRSGRENLLPLQPHQKWALAHTLQALNHSGAVLWCYGSPSLFLSPSHVRIVYIDHISCIMHQSVTWKCEAADRSGIRSASPVEPQRWHRRETSFVTLRLPQRGSACLDVYLPCSAATAAAQLRRESAIAHFRLYGTMEMTGCAAHRGLWAGKITCTGPH